MWLYKSWVSWSLKNAHMGFWAVENMSENVFLLIQQGLAGGGPGVVVSTAAFHARVRGSVPGLGGLKETKLFLPHPRVKVSNVGSLRDREAACSASDRQGSNFESCVWRTVSSQSSHHPQEVLLTQSSLYVHKGGLKPDSFHFISTGSSNPLRALTGPITHYGLAMYACFRYQKSGEVSVNRPISTLFCAVNMAFHYRRLNIFEILYCTGQKVSLHNTSILWYELADMNDHKKFHESIYHISRDMTFQKWPKIWRFEFSRKIESYHLH